jgi:hypothetical protein
MDSRRSRGERGSRASNDDDNDSQICAPKTSHHAGIILNEPLPTGKAHCVLARLGGLRRVPSRLGDPAAVSYVHWPICEKICSLPAMGASGNSSAA